jgi:hypothetical protein
MVDTTTYPAGTYFTPWLTAKGGNDVGKAGRLIVRQPRSDTVTPELELPSSLAGFQVFVNDIRRNASAVIAATTRVYPSRVLVSYENYPEIIDSPISVLDTESDSAVDVNPADGQEITGIIPFFGETAFSAAQQEAILVVFKSNSIYLVNIAEKRAGRNAVQRIETEGLGCTAPYSIASTKRGIIFANDSGIYCLRRDQSIQYIGKYMERNWLEKADREALSIMHGHHYGIGRSYKLAVPILGTDTQEPSQVYVYNHTNENEGQGLLGAWGRYDQHNAIGWANLDADAFYASTRGRVLSIRRQGTVTDFRDSSDSVPFRLDTRALDMGNSGIRKILGSVVAAYRTLVRNLATRLYFSLDLESEYSSSTPITIPKPTAATQLSDEVPRDIYTVLHEIARMKAITFSIRVENDGYDENIELAGLDLEVGGLSSKGITEAEGTSRK